MRSLFAGVSGLSNHQQRMDVIGNNISNVNTIGFKSSRMTFMDAMSQTISYGRSASGTAGSKNPMQIGVGMKISSIDTNFGQGMLQSTGMTTDLALEGEGFFVVNDGSGNAYTRAGAFQIDANGYLLAQGGSYYVQGITANSAGEIPSGGTIGNIKLPYDQKSPAKATTEIKYHCNLDASKGAKENIIKGDWGSPAKIAGGTVADYSSAVAVDDGSGNFVGNTFTISLNGGPAETVQIASTVTTPPASPTALANVLNEAVMANPNLAGKVKVIVNKAGDGVEFQTVESGGKNLTINVTSGTVDITQLGFAASPVEGKGTDLDTAINELSFVASDISDGDVITIAGTDSNGDVISKEFTYGAANDGTTVQDLLNSISSGYKGVTVSLENGKIVLTDSIKGTSKTSISLNLRDTDDSGSTMSVPTFITEQKGEEAGTHSASIYVYDSLGAKHTVEVTFVKNDAEDNLWNWTAEVNGGNTTIISGGSGFVKFNNDGSIASMDSNPPGEKLTFDSSGGADQMEISLNGGESGSFSGISQYDSPFTTVAYEQDGYTMGVLQDVFVDEAGIIWGDYTNSQTQKLAQLSLATFNNEQGLLKKGNNLFTTSPSSGSAKLGYAGTNNSTLVRSGNLEGSNVDLTKELTDMIITQRGFQANTKTINTADSMLQELITRVKRS